MKESQPRDIILFLNKVCEVQNQRLERGGDDPPDDLLFDRASFKDALPALSEYRVSRVLFAEYADLSCTRFRRHRVRCFMEQEVCHGETAVYARVQA